MSYSFAKNHSVRVFVFALAFAGLASWATSRNYLLSNPFVTQAALPPAMADLAISKTATPSAGVAQGAQMNYTITVSNGGPDAATDVNVSDLLSAGTTFVSSTPSQGSCTAPAPGPGGTVNCALGSIAAPGKATINLVVTFTAAPGSAIANTATVSTSSVDANSANDSATSNTMVAQTFCASVTNTNDSGTGSLRAAILCANTNPGLDAITFNIPGGGVHTIALLSGLPLIGTPIYLDGYSQPGASQNTLATGDNAVLAVELNGTSAGSSSNGVNIIPGGSGSTVRGLVINKFGNHGVSLSNGNRIEGNFIGTNAAGSAALPNTHDGIQINNGSNNVIGGANNGARNIISGNGVLSSPPQPTNGVDLFGSLSNSNVVQNNYLGTDATGTLAVPNLGFGVVSNGSPNNTIVGNLISGNVQSGISLFTNTANGNSIKGNFIGTTANGSAPLSNFIGITISGGSQNTIGDATASGRNVISGNRSSGILINGGANLNVVQGNLVGTDVSGTAAVPNCTQSPGAGILINGSSNTVGGASSAARNIISGNSAGGGVLVQGGGSSANSIQGNYIGTDITGTAALGNIKRGVMIDGGNNNTIAGNVVSGNNGTGVSVESFGAGNQVQANLIGTQADGVSALGNTQFGVLIDRSSNNAITMNTVAFNGSSSSLSAGVVVSTFDPGNGTGPSAGNAIRQNSIYSNFGLGIDLVDSLTFGVTPNDACDTDTGGNNFQNSPVLSSLSSAGGNTTIQGTLNSSPNTAFTIEFFANVAADPSGSGEGQTYLGSTTVTTGADCNAAFSFAFPDNPGQPVITATATDPAGNTSEFSAWVGTTTTTLTSDHNPSTYGQSVTFAATVTSAAGTPTGTVTFKDGGTTLGTGTLDGSGQATLTTSSLPAGMHSITAVYSGTDNYLSSSSGVLTQTVNQASTSTTLSSNANPSTYVQNVTFNATVTSAGGTPTGTVTFRDGATVLATVPVDGSGHAAYTTSSLFIGAHAITATYNGDANFTGSASTALVQTVVPPLSTESVKVNGGGFITLTTGGNGSFGLEGKVSKTDVASGNVEYQDHDAGLNIKSTTITAVAVTGTHARMFGKATVNGSGSFDFIVDVDDLGEPGAGVDKFQIQLSNGYTAGAALLSGGNIQVHN